MSRREPIAVARLTRPMSVGAGDDALAEFPNGRSAGGGPSVSAPRPSSLPRTVAADSRPPARRAPPYKPRWRSWWPFGAEPRQLGCRSNPGPTVPLRRLCRIALS